MYLGMSLLEWLSETKTTMAKCGSAVKRAQSIISHVANHKHRPDPSTAVRLVALSKGHITLNSLYNTPLKHRCKCEQEAVSKASKKH